MLEETVRVFRDENGDHLSEPEEVVLSSALTNKKEALPPNVRIDNLQDQVNRNRIRRQAIINSFSDESRANQETSRAQIQAGCDHKSGLGYDATITQPIPGGTIRRVCTRCNKSWSVAAHLPSPEDESALQQRMAGNYQQQAASADQMSAYSNAQGQGTYSGAWGGANSPGLANANSSNSQGLTNAYGLLPAIPTEAWAQADLLNDATPSEPESLLDGTSSPGVAGTSEDGTALTATGIRRAFDFMSGKNVTPVDLPARTGNPIQFFSQPVGYRTSLGVSSPDPKNDPIKDPMTEGEAGFQAWLLKENSTLGKIKGWVGKRIAKRKKHSQSKSLLKELLKIKAEVESLPMEALVSPAEFAVEYQVDASKAPFSHERYEAWRDSYSGFHQSQ